MWERRRFEPESVTAAGVGEECEAFVSGRWVEYLEARGELVPSWAWLNRVVHADPEELRALRVPPRRHQLEDWSQARTFLAVELLDLADERPEAAADLQRDVLVPFELALFDDADARRLTPGQLLARILPLLRCSDMPDRFGNG